MNWFEIFKAGEQTDSKGNVRNWTKADLDNMVAKYDPQNHEAPIVIGHPKDNSPAYGWIESVKRVGDKLLAFPKQVVPEFAEMVNNGMFKKRSISLYPDGTIRHVGFLGAVPPAVKGLADVQFSEGDNVVIEFSENYRINTIGSLFQNIRDWFISKFGLEVADQVVGQYDIDNLKQFIPDDPIVAPAFSDNINEEDEMELKEENEKLKRENEKLKKENSDFAESIAAKEEENAKLKTDIAAKEKADRTKDYENFCEGLIKEGKLLPANKPGVLQQLEAAHLSGLSLEFSENGETKKISAVDKYKAMLSESPKIIDYGEVATNAQAGEAINGDANEIAKKATEFKEEEKKHGREISYTEAVNHIVNKK